jgi:hypothetical protein
MSIFDSLKNLVGRGPEPVEPAPVAAVVPEPEQSVIPVAEPEPAPVAVVIPNLSGLMDAGVAASAPQPEPAPEEVSFVPDDYGQNPERPVIEEEELNDDLPPRTRQRIDFLLRTYEAGDILKTMRRIESDKVRYMWGKQRRMGPKKPVSRAANPQAHLKDPGTPVPAKTTWS